MSERHVLWIALAIVVGVLLYAIAPMFWSWCLWRKARRNDSLRFDQWIEHYRVVIRGACSDVRDAIDRGDRDAAHAALDRITGAKL